MSSTNESTIYNYTYTERPNDSRSENDIVKITPNKVLARLEEAVKSLLKQLNNDCQDSRNFIHEIEHLFSLSKTSDNGVSEEADVKQAAAVTPSSQEISTETRIRQIAYNTKTVEKGRCVIATFSKKLDDLFLMTTKTQAAPEPTTVKVASESTPIKAAPKRTTIKDGAKHIFYLRTRLIHILNAHPKVDTSLLQTNIQVIHYFKNIPALMKIQEQWDQILADRNTCNDPSLGDGNLCEFAMEAYTLGETRYAKEIISSIHTHMIRALSFFDIIKSLVVDKNSENLLGDKNSLNEAMKTADRAPLTFELRARFRHKVLELVLGTANKENEAKIAQIAYETTKCIEFNDDKIPCFEQILQHFKQTQNDCSCFSVCFSTKTTKKVKSSLQVQLDIIEDCLHEAIRVKKLEEERFKKEKEEKLKKQGTAAPSLSS